MHPTKFWFNWQSGFRGEDFLEIIQSEPSLWWSYLLTDRDEMINHNRGLSIDASYQVSVHLAKLLQRERFLEIDQSETIIAHGGHVR